MAALHNWHEKWIRSGRSSDRVDDLDPLHRHGGDALEQLDE